MRPDEILSSFFALLRTYPAIAALLALCAVAGAVAFVALPSGSQDDGESRGFLLVYASHTMSLVRSPVAGFGRAAASPRARPREHIVDTQRSAGAPAPSPARVCCASMGFRVRARCRRCTQQAPSARRSAPASPRRCPRCGPAGPVTPALTGSWIKVKLAKRVDLTHNTGEPARGARWCGAARIHSSERRPSL